MEKVQETESYRIPSLVDSKPSKATEREVRPCIHNRNPGKKERKKGRRGKKPDADTQNIEIPRGFT
jgi:hypothetical protein